MGSRRRVDVDGRCEAREYTCVFLEQASATGEGGVDGALRMEQSAENQATTCSTRGDDGRRSLLEVLRSGAGPNNRDRDNYCNYRRNSERGKDTPGRAKPRYFDANLNRLVQTRRATLLARVPDFRLYNDGHDLDD